MPGVLSEKTAGELSDLRRKAVLDRARKIGLLGDAKDARIAGRVPDALIKAAKKRAHVESDTDLIEYALSALALGDDFGAKLVQRKGAVSRDIDLEF
ncbi:MAG: hypothetical protein U0942_00575 [Parvibaculum sp.]|uniref:hypothetical protein n=1 Tax=Parvibaculum sp. TaxID=2024848 RepID=UPI002AB91DE1|nr:hypothetical protein [Parvibaculum sp.]MDZ4379816.1 hypothetical protein [Parvibaculum sp.]